MATSFWRLAILGERGVIVAVVLASTVTMEQKRGELHGDRNRDPNLPVRKESLRNGELARPLQISGNAPPAKRPCHQGQRRHER